MKLLLDQNLSPRLVGHLREAFPGSTHVRDLGLEAAPDEDVWRRALADGFGILSKDSDFYHRSVLRGYPPKVVWVALGNCSTDDVLARIQEALDDLPEFDDDEQRSILILR